MPLSNSATSSATQSASAAPAALITMGGKHGRQRAAGRHHWRPRATAWVFTLRASLFFAVLGATLIMVAFELDNAAFAFFYKNNPVYGDTDDTAASGAGSVAQTKAHAHASSDDEYDDTVVRDWFPEKASLFGDWWGLMVACALIAGIIAWRRPRHWRYYLRVIVAMMLTSTLAGALTNTIRLVSCRARPTSQVEPGFYPLYNGKERAIFRHAYSSFPSGHAATAAGLFTLVVLLNWRLGLLMFLVPLVVAWSRLYFGVHHLSDVTGSLVIAFFMAAWVWTYLMPWLRVKQMLSWSKRQPLSGRQMAST